MADGSHLECVLRPAETEKMDISQIIELARGALEIEHQKGPWQAIKSHPMAIFWSLMVSMCVVMEGMYVIDKYFGSLHMLTDRIRL